MSRVLATCVLLSYLVYLSFVSFATPHQIAPLPTTMGFRGGGGGVDDGFAPLYLYIKRIGIVVTYGCVSVLLFVTCSCLLVHTV
jgi:hypothetical protein